jgi:hypothetical protein
MREPCERRHHGSDPRLVLMSVAEEDVRSAHAADRVDLAQSTVLPAGARHKHRDGVSAYILALPISPRMADFWETGVARAMSLLTPPPADLPVDEPRFEEQRRI